MKRLFLFISVLISACTVYSQGGFIKKYNFGGLPYVEFVDVIRESSGNLIAYGFGLDTLDNPHQGFLIARLDTLGNIMDYNIAYVQNEGATGYTPVRDIIEIEGGGFAAVGASFFSNEGMFLKFKHDLSIDTMQYYPIMDGGYIYDVQYIQPASDGYILGGTEGYLVGGGRPFVHKVDTDGNLIWTKYYTDNTNTTNFLTDVVKLSDNEYVLAGVSYPLSTDATNYKYLGWMIGIDTSGTELWSWQNDTIEYNLGLGELLKNGDDGWVVINFRTEWGPNGNKKYYTGLTRLNEAKEVVWDTPLGTGQPYSSIGAVVYDIAQTIDSNWVAVGSILLDSLNAQAAWMVAVTPDGDSLWARTDTLQHVTGTAYQSGLHGLVVLPSGSIMAAGRTQHPNGRYYGLLIKTDPRGCIDPDCHPYMSLLSADDNADAFEFGMSPNPTSGLLRITCPGVTPFSAEVYDGAGRVLASNPTMHCGETLNVSALPSGQYFIRVHTEGSQTVVHSVIRL